MPKVYNIRNGFPKDAVLVDRTTPFGNPFVIGRHGTRMECISMFKQKVLSDPALRKLVDGLRGKDLICHCKPLPCHGDVILELANSGHIEF